MRPADPAPADQILAADLVDLEVPASLCGETVADPLALGHGVNGGTLSIDDARADQEEVVLTTTVGVAGDYRIGSLDPAALVREADTDEVVGQAVAHVPQDYAGNHTPTGPVTLRYELGSCDGAPLEDGAYQLILHGRTSTDGTFQHAISEGYASLLPLEVVDAAIHPGDPATVNPWR